MQSPIHSSPGGMQSPMRHGSQMMPGTPDGIIGFQSENIA